MAAFPPETMPVVARRRPGRRALDGQLALFPAIEQIGLGAPDVAIDGDERRRSSTDHLFPRCPQEGR